ncbi:MAG: hypothetical protein LUD72_05875 [Bacteroidales bacterium]|nr:hypothetical protein [Bacteroidales bacterium]
MKVYTHFYPLTDTGDGFRWRTLLQFGDSWNVIGSVVMKNPGSARFLSPDRHAIVDSHILTELRKFDSGDTAKDDWYEFSSDTTMACVAELFSQHYMYEGSPLNGVIQIFNLFYIREADFGKALAKAEMFRTPERMTQYDIDNLTVPVYLGFSGLARHKVYGKVAKQFFDKALQLGVSYLNADFLSNAFTHPLCLMRYRKNSPQCVSLRNRFIQDKVA